MHVNEIRKLYKEKEAERHEANKKKLQENLLQIQKEGNFMADAILEEMKTRLSFPLIRIMETKNSRNFYDHELCAIRDIATSKIESFGFNCLRFENRYGSYIEITLPNEETSTLLPIPSAPDAIDRTSQASPSYTTKVHNQETQDLNAIDLNSQPSPSYTTKIHNQETQDQPPAPPSYTEAMKEENSKKKVDAFVYAFNNINLVLLVVVMTDH